MPALTPDKQGSILKLPIIYWAYLMFTAPFCLVPAFHMLF